jgi:hypothetical protein
MKGGATRKAGTDFIPGTYLVVVEFHSLKVGQKAQAKTYV